MHVSAYVNLAVRLVNTAGPRTASAATATAAPTRGDGLASVADLRTMLTDQPVWRRMAEDADLAPLRALRSEVRTVFEDASVGEESAAARRINVLLGTVQVIPRLTGHDSTAWHMHLAEGAASAAAGYSAAAVLGIGFYVGDQGFRRLGVCRSDVCPQVFLDTSSNRSRRYCSDRCASRANVAAFRARHRARAADRRD